MNSDSICKNLWCRIHVLLAYEGCNLLEDCLSKFDIWVGLKSLDDNSYNYYSDFWVSIEEELIQKVLIDLLQVPLRHIFICIEDAFNIAVELLHLLSLSSTSEENQVEVKYKCLWIHFVL